jgi:hypothetical protein
MLTNRRTSLDHAPSPKPLRKFPHTCKPEMREEGGRSQRPRVSRLASPHNPARQHLPPPQQLLQFKLRLGSPSVRDQRVAGRGFGAFGVDDDALAGGHGVSAAAAVDALHLADGHAVAFADGRQRVAFAGGD